MKKAIKILLIIAAVCAGVGILLIGVGAATGATIGEFNRETQENDLLRKMHVSIGFWDTDDWEESGSEISCEYDSKEVENLHITLNAGELELLKSDSDKIIVEMTGRASGDDVVLKDATLSVEDHTNHTGIRTDGVRIRVYLPENMKLQNLNLTVHAGKATCKVDEITAENVVIEVDAGELTAEGSICANKGTAVTVGAGEADIAYLSTGNLELDCGIGETDITLDSRGDVIVSCGVGEVNLKLYGTEDSYNYDLNCGVGEMRIGNSSYSGLGSSKSISNGAEKKLEAECGVGELTVQFIQ
ncbi:MAG: DUF4097 family beta strand repeat-containing protein [Roseburia sp.]